jgi:hypothetical protein
MKNINLEYIIEEYFKLIKQPQSCTFQYKNIREHPIQTNNRCHLSVLILSKKQFKGNGPASGFGRQHDWTLTAIIFRS